MSQARSLRLRALAAAAALLLASCSGGGGSPAPGPTGSPATTRPASPASPALPGSTRAPTSPAATGSAPAGSPTGEAPSGVPSPGEGEFSNPVIEADFPDPHVILADEMYYAYATNDGQSNIRVARSPDLVEWDILGEALPRLPRWSGLTPLFGPTAHMATWAPAVARPSGGYVMYYTTPALQMPRPDGKPSQCIGTAVSEQPQGPFSDRSEGPIVCQPELGGSIDATYFEDEDGTQYLIWKNDGNCCAIETNFFIQELSEDGLEVVGQPTEMGVRNDTRWERHVIEAPTLLEHDGTYYLFYSGNDFASVRYAVGYATSADVLGPYEDAEENPILATDPPAAGPGHQSVVIDKDGDLWMTYHAWDIKAVGYQVGGRRAMWIDELFFENGRPVVDGPDVGPQPVP